jgi:hypothetical protein
VSCGSPVLADPVGPLEVGKHEDVEQLGAWRRTEGVESLPQLSLEQIGSHGLGATLSDCRPRIRRAYPYTFANAGARKVDHPATTSKGHDSGEVILHRTGRSRRTIQEDGDEVQDRDPA